MSATHFAERGLRIPENLAVWPPRSRRSRPWIPRTLPARLRQPLHVVVTHSRDTCAHTINKNSLSDQLKETSFKNNCRFEPRGIAWCPRAVGSPFNPGNLCSPQFKIVQRDNPKVMSEGGPIIHTHQKKTYAGHLLTMDT